MKFYGMKKKDLPGGKSFVQTKYIGITYPRFSNDSVSCCEYAGHASLLQELKTIPRLNTTTKMMAALFMAFDLDPHG